ncbi:MAG: glycosyltransferase family 39 protein [Candidatus Omnitrophica bacterium]|nr:glycosyltransferase family 39 protein [Candidatus Omnitrophota bacterium]
MPLLAGLPVIAFLLILIALIKKSPFGFRLSFLWAAAIWSFVAVAMSEGFSISHALTQGFVAGGWAATACVALIVLFVYPNGPQKNGLDKLKDFSKTEMTLGILAILAIVVVGVNAFFAAPNNWDSMTYHLPRVLHWVQDRSIEYYPTHILRQLYQPPGAEFFILQFQILSNSDRFSNLIQWFAMLSSALVLSLIVGELGAGRKGQLLTAFLSVTIPMGILKGSSTQNDYVAGFWLAASVLFGLRCLRPDRPRQAWFDAIGAGLSLGFAFLTKGTVYVFVTPWVLAFVLTGVLKKRKSVFSDIIVIALICLAVNAGFYSRNIKLFGAPLSAGTEDYMNTGGMLNNGLSNVIRNTALHFGTPNPEFNAVLKEKVLQLQSGLGLGKTGAANTWGEFDIPLWSTSEDIAGNPLHVVLIVVALILVFVQRQPALLRFYSLAVIASFLLFCILLKWQLFHSRLQLPLFLLSVPIVAWVLEKVRPRFFIPLLAIFLVLSSLPPLFCNERHPLVGKKNVFNMPRAEQYFSYRKFMALPYLVAVKYTASRPASDVGLLLGGDDWEYPLWILLKKDRPDIKIRHVGVNNVSRSLTGSNDGSVSLIISELADPPDHLTFDGKVYLKRQQFSFMSIYEN